MVGKKADTKARLIPSLALLGWVTLNWDSEILLPPDQRPLTTTSRRIGGGRVAWALGCEIQA